MCGIAGIFDSAGKPCPREELLKMHAALVHRGPDDAGCFADGEAGLAFQRLAILDLQHGKQPVSSPDGRFTLVFNGEIYNHLELRGPLQARGWHFRTRSDSETLLAAFALDGADSFRKLNGMFACAVWDSRKKALTLAREPLGIKPLYIFRKGTSLYFSSELRALLSAADPAALDQEGVLDYLTFGYTHAPGTVIRGIEKFPAGHWLTMDASGSGTPVRYWSLPAEEENDIPEDEAAARLRELLEASVRDQLMGDVPAGVFLSGGLDSSLVTALMAKYSHGPVKSFSIGFDGKESVDETRYAESVSRRFGTSHETIKLPAGVLDDLPSMTSALDEPVADAAVLPTLYLSRQARKSVKFVLTGEGGDEVFGGYGRHKAAYVTEVLEKLPAGLRPYALPLARKSGAGAYFRALPLEGPGSWARAEAAPYRGAARLVMGLPEDGSPAYPWMTPYAYLRGLNGMLAFDLQTSMADQLLMKVDKTAIRASLEARVPLLDLRLVDFMFRLGAAHKVRRFRGKFLLRKAVRDLLPREILTRRKHGFVLRCADWIRSPSNSLCGDALTGDLLPSTGLFRRDVLQKGVAALRGGSMEANPVFYFRLLVLALWLYGLRGGTGGTLQGCNVPER